MRFMTIVKGNEAHNMTKAGPPPAELIEAIEKANEEGLKSGKMESFGGLWPTSHGARVRVVNGKVVATDGPFTEAKEVIGGYSVMHFASKEEAVEEARKFMELSYRLWPAWEGEVEIRPMYGAEDRIG